mgnify:CR=1 FL=1
MGTNTWGREGPGRAVTHAARRRVWLCVSTTRGRAEPEARVHVCVCVLHTADGTRLCAYRPRLSYLRAGPCPRGQGARVEWVHTPIYTHIRIQ